MTELSKRDTQTTVTLQPNTLDKKPSVASEVTAQTQLKPGSKKLHEERSSLASNHGPSQLNSSGRTQERHGSNDHMKYISIKEVPGEIRNRRTKTQVNIKSGAGTLVDRRGVKTMRASKSPNVKAPNTTKARPANFTQRFK